MWYSWRLLEYRLMKKIITYTTWIIASIYIGMIFFSWMINDNLSENLRYNVVVYGNMVYPNGDLSSRLEARLNHVMTLYETQNIEKIIVSGWIWNEWVDEAIAMWKYLEKEGISKNMIIVDSDGYTTKKTSQNARSIIKNNDIAIIWVSQWFHIPRIKLSLRKEWFNEVLGSAPIYFEKRDIYSFFRELPAYMKYAFN